MFNNIKTTLLELPIVSGSTALSFYFPTQNFLRDKEVVSIETFFNTDVPNSPYTIDNELPTPAQGATAFLTLYGANPEDKSAMAEWMELIPLVSLHRINNQADPFVFSLYTLVPRKIVWEKSYITLTAPLGADTGVSFLFLIGYQGNDGDN